MIPDYCEAITAYRCWHVFPNGLMIGQAQTVPWPPYEPFVAHCVRPVHGACHVTHTGLWIGAPAYTCDCGIHALKTHAQAVTRLLEQDGGWHAPVYYDRYSPADGRVWGAVQLWGRVVEHQIGYRAQYAYPSTLYCEDADLARRVAKLYGVPCEVATLQRPKRLPVEDVGVYYWLNNTLSVTTSPPSSQATWGAGPAPSLIAPATLAQIKGLGATQYQQAQARLAAQQPAPDWREMMRRAFHACTPQASGGSNGA